MTPSKSARYLLARFIEPAFREGPDSGERLIGVASFKEFEEKFTVALYDVPVLVRPADVLLLRFEPLIDVAAFATGCCFNWQLGGGTMAAVCQVLSKTVMKGFKATDPPTSSRIVGFREAGPLPLHRDLAQARFAEDLEVFSSIVELDETQEVTPEIVDAVLGNGDGLSLEERSLLAAARQLCEVLEGEGVGGTEYRAYEAAEAAFLETRKGKK